MTNTEGVIASRIRPLILLFAALVAALATAPSAYATVHTVVAGESVHAIAAAHGTTPAAVIRANRLSTPNLIHPGDRLDIPSGGSAGATASAAPAAPAGFVVVRGGDTLSAIALRAGVSVRTLAAANAIADPNYIRAGMRLRLPAAGATGTATGSLGGTDASGRHVVRAGDTLWGIARRNGTSVSALAGANGMRASDVLTVGRRLVVPAGTASARSTQAAASSGAAVYVVRSGDTLSAIAVRTGSTVAALARANGVADPNAIRVGMRLRVVRAASAVATAAPATSAVPRTPITAATAGWGSQPSTDAVRAMIASSASRYGVDPALIRAIAWQESGWWQGARSTAGAMGVMQLMPDTATWVGPALVGRRIDATVAADNIDGGTALVGWLLRNASSRDQAIAAYYQGLGSVRSRGMYSDTRDYVASVNRHYGVR